MSSLPDEEPLPTNVEEAEALIERHKRAILRISSHVNRFSSAAFVPDEILCEIFKLYATDSLENGVYPYEFIKLAHICRYWRAIVLGCASLWTHIKVVDSLNFPPFLRTMKDWSRNRPLTVSAVLKNNTKSKSPAALKILFTKVFDRIRELDIQAQDRNLPALFKFISQRGCLPMLRTLKIKRLPLTSRRPTSLADIVFPCWNELPALQNLVIDGYPLQVIRPLISQSIRSLTFLQSEVGCRFGNLSTDVLSTLLFDILSATPVLEYLYFATSLSPSPLQHQVDLPHLKSLTVREVSNSNNHHYHGLLQIIQSLRFPLKTKLHIDISPGNFVDRWVTAISSHLDHTGTSSHLLHHISLTSFVERYRTDGLDWNEEPKLKSQLIGWSGAGPCAYTFPLLPDELEPQLRLEMDHCTESDLAMLFLCMPFTFVETMHFNGLGIGRARDSLRPAPLLGIYYGLPNLTKLVLEHIHEVHVADILLSSPSGCTPNSDSSTPTLPPGDQQLFPFPRLEMLELAYIEFVYIPCPPGVLLKDHVAIYDNIGIFYALHRRATAGMRIEKLGFRMHTFRLLPGLGERIERMQSFKFPSD